MVSEEEMANEIHRAFMTVNRRINQQIEALQQLKARIKVLEDGKK